MPRPKESWGYKRFIHDHESPWCWACGRDQWSPPHNWCAPYLLERAHLGSGSGAMYRIRDERAIAILCSRCHYLHTKIKFRFVNGEELPCLSDGNLIHLKRLMDPGHWDREFVARYWIGCVPDAEPLPSFYEESYIQIRGPRTPG